MLSGVLHRFLVSSLLALSPPQLSHGSHLGSHLDPTFNSPANSCHTGFCLSLGWWVFISHSIICPSVSCQMSAEGQALFWVMGTQRGMRQSCSQADCPQPRGARRGGGKFSAGDTEDPEGSGACLALC